MFVPTELIQQLAAELHESEKSRVQVEHFSKRFPGMTIEDGYAISRAWVKMKIAEGRVARGHKIGLTSRAMQLSSQIDEPDYGTLLDDMFFEPGDIPADALHRAAGRGGAGLRARSAAAGRRRRASTTCWPPPTTWRRPSRSSTRASSSSTATARRMRKVLRHHQRQRGQCRHRAGRPPGASPTRVDLPWVRRHPATERRGRGDRPGRRRAGPPRHRRGLAGQQAGALGRVPGSRRGRAGRLLHPPGRRRSRATCSTPTTGRSAASTFASSERRHHMQTPVNPFKQALRREAHADRPVARPGRRATPPRSAPAPASTGC